MRTREHGIPVVLCLVTLLLAGCATTPGAGGAAQSPQVKLERVEVASYFPYAAPPARVPMVLAFVYKVSNPNDTPVALEELKFTVSFEAKPGEYFALNTATLYETMHIPGKTSNELRVTTVLDSLVAPGNLAVTSGQRVTALGLKPGDVVKEWWEKIGDFSYGIKVSEGVAMFNGGSVIVSFEDSFPKK
jgi:predicted small secreted protein